MRAYPYVQVSLAIALVIAASLAATLVCPPDAMAREPEYEMMTKQSNGGTSGGGEWKTPPEDPPQLPIDLEDERGRGGVYSEPRVSASEDAWPERVNRMVTRMVRFVGITFSELF